MAPEAAALPEHAPESELVIEQSLPLGEDFAEDLAVSESDPQLPSDKDDTERERAHGWLSDEASH